MDRKKTISIITVCFNAALDLQKTINSIRNQTFTDYEYIVVDGGSKDNTLQVIEDNSSFINKWISEADRGIYDAMNKGLKMSSAEWVIMMNAGDVFVDEYVLSKIFNQDIPDDKTFLYGDFLSLLDNGTIVRRETSFDKGFLNHQSIIYRRRLHDEHGLYIVTKKLIISDYLFFIRIPRNEVMRLNMPIAIYDIHGVSSNNSWPFYQRICADVCLGRTSFLEMQRRNCVRNIKKILPSFLIDILKKLKK